MESETGGALEQIKLELKHVPVTSVSSVLLFPDGQTRL